MALIVPNVKPDDDTLGAALAYAAAGWFILPVHNDERRLPALGKDWPSKTSTDPQVVSSWFAGTDLLLGLHVGRSGAIVFDVDYPDKVPPVLLKHFTREVPHQSTRADLPERGHWVFAQPPGRYLGNSRGDLGKDWGEVRGANGMIVVAPSRHHKADFGGRYEWLTTGEVPPLPDELSESLPDFTGRAGAAAPAMVSAFMDTFIRSDRPMAMRAIVQKFNAEAQTGSRHEALMQALAWAMREAAMGLFPAKDAAVAIWTDWREIMKGEQGRAFKDEFQGALAWAVGAALADADRLEARAQEVRDRLDDSAIMPDLNTPAELLGETKKLPGRPKRTEVGLEEGGSNVTGGGDSGIRRPEDYFGKAGLDVSLLADDVLSLGQLAWGDDNSFWSYEDGFWARDRDAVEARVVRLLAGRFRGAHATNAVTVVRHRVDRLACAPVERMMNFRNGMLDWRTGEMSEHAPHYGSTVQFSYDYDENATCPKFDSFLASILSNDYIVLVWEMIGYLMMSGNPLQRAFMLLGSGSNGKGTLMRVVRELLGPENVATESLNSLSTNRFTPANLHAKIANIAGDIDATYQESTAQFKMLTGEDTFSAERKFGDSFSFTNWAVPVFSANRIPGSADTSEGYLRRWVIVEFAKTIPAMQRIPGFSDVFLTELPGIAAKAIVALRDMMNRNSGRGGFHISDEITAGADRFAESIDQVRMWISSGSIIVAEAGQEMETDVFKAYRAWAEVNKYGVLRSGEFFSRLVSVPGVERKKVRGVRMVRGLTIVDSRLANGDAAKSASAEFFGDDD